MYIRVLYVYRRGYVAIRNGAGHKEQSGFEVRTGIFIHSCSTVVRSETRIASPALEMRGTNPNQPSMNPFHNQHEHTQHPFGDEQAMIRMELVEQPIEYVVGLGHGSSDRTRDSCMGGGTNLTEHSSAAMSLTQPQTIDSDDIMIEGDDTIIPDDPRRWSIRRSQLIDPGDVARVFEPRCVPTKFDVCTYGHSLYGPGLLATVCVVLQSSLVYWPFHDLTRISLFQRSCSVRSRGHFQPRRKSSIFT